MRKNTVNGKNPFIFRMFLGSKIQKHYSHLWIQKLLILGLVAIILLVLFAIFMSRKFYRGSLMGWKARVGSLVGIVLIMLPIGQNFS